MLSFFTLNKIKKWDKTMKETIKHDYFVVSFIFPSLIYF